MPLLLDHDLRTLSAAPASLVYARASAATRIGPTGLIETVAAGVPRQQHDPATGAVLGWLIEDAATNLLANPEDLTSVWALAGITIAGNVDTAPDGTTQADRLNETAPVGQHAVFQTLTKAATSQTYTGSIFVKAAGRSEVQLSLRSGSNGTRFDFNLGSPGTLSATAYGSGWSVVGASILSLPGGWFRLSATVRSDATTQIRFLVRPLLGGLDSYAGDPAQGLLLWGANLILADHESSYTPGVRLADSLSADGAARTILLRGRLRQSLPGLYAQLDAGSNTDAIQLGWDTAPYVRVLAGGAEQMRLAPGVLPATERMSLAASWGDGAVRTSLNGGAAVTAAATPAAITRLRIARTTGTGAIPVIAERLAVWDDAQDAASLAALSSLLPPAPTGLTVTRAGPRAAQLSWRNPPGVLTSLLIAHASDVAFADAVMRTDLPPDAQSLLIDDLPAANVRAFRVRAVNSDGAGAWSAAAVLIDGARRMSPASDARRTAVRAE